ncbi:MAG: phage terminase large subunit, partial [Pyrinomonadaceae bacterium]
DKVQITLSYNPIDEHHWINTEIHEQRPPGHFIFKTTYKDNEKMLAVDPTYADYIESLAAEDSNYYKVYGLGEWGSVVEGLIYENVGIIDEFPQDEQGRDDIHFYGLDFGFSDPLALIAQHVQDASPKKKLINKEVVYETGLDGPAMVAKFDSLGVRKDRWIVADNARPEMIKPLKDAGYKIKACEKFAGSVLSGINDVRKFQIEIAGGSKNLIREIRNYRKNQVQGIWVEDPAKNQADHGLDAMRYGAETVKKKRVNYQQPSHFAQPSY